MGKFIDDYHENLRELGNAGKHINNDLSALEQSCEKLIETMEAHPDNRDKHFNDLKDFAGAVFGYFVWLKQSNNAIHSLQDLEITRFLNSARRLSTEKIRR